MTRSKWQRAWTGGQLGIFDAPLRASPPAPFRELLIWNVGHPSSTRASAQLEWLLSQAPDVIVLSETAQNDGCEHLQEGLARAGYRVVASSPPGREFGSVIASRSGAVPSEFVDRLDQLPFRAASVDLESEAIEIIGVYVPSRDGKLSRSYEMEQVKIARKRGFLESFLRALTLRAGGERIVCGDFNVIPQNHIPPEPAFQQWEYDFLHGLESMGLRDAFTLNEPERQDHSWFGHFGDRYRFDYCYVTRAISDRVRDASFDHSPRQLNLSDHSALRVRFAPTSRDVEPR
jgi:exodeoxyribonuclease-3